jgi:hypothetical protein
MLARSISIRLVNPDPLARDVGTLQTVKKTAG